MEHRWGARVALDRAVRISGSGITGSGILRNLSVSGAFIETPLPLAGLVVVRIRVPDGLNGGTAEQKAAGFVVRREPGGFGIEWCELAAIHPADVRSSPEYATWPLHKPAVPRRRIAS